MMFRPTLLMLTAAAAALSGVAHAVSAAGGADNAAPQTRLGASIAEDIDARDQQAARRKRALDLREQAARATEQRLQAELQSQQPTGPAAGARPGTAASTGEDQYDELARIYQAMKPAKAAVVFEQLDMNVQMKVAQKMRERSTALILANMTPKGAAALTMSLARLPVRPNQQ